MVVCDIEGNGLLPDINEVWCICATSVDEGVEHSFTPNDLEFGLDYLSQVGCIIGHNFIGYDLPALKKVYGFDYDGTIIDTMILSQLMFPERPGGHSLAAWGERLGFAKVEHEDWSQYSEDMLHRCQVDVSLTKMVYEALCSEAGGTFEGVPIPEYQMR